MKTTTTIPVEIEISKTSDVLANCLVSLCKPGHEKLFVILMDFTQSSGPDAKRLFDDFILLAAETMTLEVKMGMCNALLKNSSPEMALGIIQWITEIIIN